MSKRKVSESVKKQVAGRQRYKCATLPNYSCPLKNEPFDEAGYDIDHIVELRNGGSNDISNLQALCPACHRVKTTRNTANIVEHQRPIEKHPNAFKEVIINGKTIRIIQARS
jgi:5-methylcytosine-specific restriction endonuclease McrA